MIDTRGRRRGWLVWPLLLLICGTLPAAAQEAGGADVAQVSSEAAVKNFISQQRGNVEHYLQQLEAMFNDCCLDDDRLFGSTSAGCPKGDLFLDHLDQRPSYDSGPIANQRPGISPSVQELFETHITENERCLDDECKIKEKEYRLFATPLGGQIGGGNITLGDKRCGLSINLIRMSQRGFSRFHYRQSFADGAKNQQISAKPEEPVTLTAKIVGPAQMARHTIKWEVKYGEIEPQGGFVQDEKYWTASALFRPVFFPAKVAITIDADGRKWQMQPFTVTGRLAPLQKLLITRVNPLGQERKLQPADVLDLFTPSDLSAVSAELDLSALMLNGEEVPAWVAWQQGLEDISLNTADPNVAEIAMAAGLDAGKVQILAKSAGSTDLLVHYPRNLAQRRSYSVTEHYYVNVHKLRVAKVYEGNAAVLQVMGVGPRMGYYRIVWKDNGGGKSPFTMGLGEPVWIARAPAQGVRTLDVVDDSGFVAARLDISHRAPADPVTVQLLTPPEPSYTIMQELPVPGTGATFGEWALTSGFCKKVQDNRLPKGASGSLSAAEAEKTLQAAREACSDPSRAKEEARAIRNAVLAFNKVVRRMAKGGGEVIGLEQERVSLGAAIKGLSWRQAEDAYCRWWLEGGGESQLEFEYAPVQMLGLDSAACFNRVGNLVRGFVPGMKVHVELILDITP